MIIQRCMMIEGIGRVHVLGEKDDPRSCCAVMDNGADIAASMQAADIVYGDRPGRVLWSVRFNEKERPS